MPFSVQDFRNKLAKGGARPSLFEMQITWPDALRGAVNVSTAERDFRFLCQISEIPASTVGSFQVPYFGRKLNFAGDRKFEALTVTVLNDEDFKVRKALEAWSAAITGHVTVTSRFGGGINAGSYATDGIVYQYGRNNGGEILAAYKFVGMWPESISNIGLDWESTDQLEKFQVGFQYQWWTSVDTVSGSEISVNL